MSATEPDDGPSRALAALVAEIGDVVAELERARQRADQLLAERRSGKPWEQIVMAEQRPLIVEQISSAMASLAGAGGHWRRTQAQALHDENVSINRIAALFGVTRQRVSALLRERES